MPIIKAIIPSAGLGSRFLPGTKAVPKEMLPILNKPAIQHIIEEALLCNINLLTIINSAHKQAIMDHFNPNLELDLLLKERSKSDLLENLQRIIKLATFTYIPQTDPRGLGHAVWLGRHCVGKEYFGVF